MPNLLKRKVRKRNSIATAWIRTCHGADGTLWSRGPGSIMENQTYKTMSSADNQRGMRSLSLLDCGYLPVKYSENIALEVPLYSTRVFEWVSYKINTRGVFDTASLSTSRPELYRRCPRVGDEFLLGIPLKNCPQFYTSERKSTSDRGLFFPYHATLLLSSQISKCDPAAEKEERRTIHTLA